MYTLQKVRFEQKRLCTERNEKVEKSVHGKASEYPVEILVLQEDNNG